MRSFALLALAALLPACDTDTPPTTADAGDGGSMLDASEDAGGGEGGSLDAAADGGADASTPGVGTPGYCESQWKGPSILVLGVTPSGGSSIYRVYPESGWDEHVVDLVYGGSSISIADIVFETNVYRVTNGAVFWNVNAPLGTGTRELGTPIGVGANGTPPTISFLAPNAPWIGRGGTSLTRLTLAPLVDWESNGSVLGAGTSCTQMRDFLSGGGGGSTFTFLATCGTDPNAVVTADVQPVMGGGWTGTSTIGTLPDASGVVGQVVAVSGTIYLTATKIYANGVYVRDLKVCMNNGNLATPIAGLRAVIQ
ncbi:MAG: hypothetical protein U0230_27470 [Polyangiales bacterium]